MNLTDLLQIIQNPQADASHRQALRNSGSPIGKEATNWASTRGMEIMDLLELFQRDPQSVWRDVMMHREGNPGRAERVMRDLAPFGASRQGQGSPPPRGFTNGYQ